MSSFNQTLPPYSPRSIPVLRHKLRYADNAARSLLDSLPNTPQTQPPTIGISISQGAEGIINSIALATTENVFLIDITVETSSGKISSDAIPFENVFKQLLAAPNATAPFLVGFDMPRLALRLFVLLGYHIKGVDLSTVCSPGGEAWIPSKIVSAKFGNIDDFRVNSLWHENNESEENLCLRAWLSAIVGQACSTEVHAVKKVDTRNVRKDIIRCLAEMSKQTDILAKALPHETTSEYDNFSRTKLGGYEINNSRYKSRVRPSKQSMVVLTDQRGCEYRGRAHQAQGKITRVKFGSGQQPTGIIQNIRVVGQDDPTNSERARNIVLLRVLQGDVNLVDYDFIRYLWFPTTEDTRVLSHRDYYEEDYYYEATVGFYVSSLNASQKEVVKGMVSSQPMVIVHGPPGTGKTTTIAAAARYWADHRQPVWIVGHSNVSVKNIAEKLWNRGVHFKILVSKEFYVEWHEHIYEGINRNVIRGDEMPADPIAMEKVMEGAQVILSTLGMLSNPALEQNRTFDLVPVERLVVDEASQINAFEYLSVFQKFRSLEKVCFFGDPKQLPPFGQEKAKSLKCIFDIKHLKRKSYFLDIQYRMPIPIGNFISRAVYDNRLRSKHNVDNLSCVSFVDVRGQEQKAVPLTGTQDFEKNPVEVDCLINLVRHYYGAKDFCIITPYDAQRSKIEKALKAEQLPWETVFNVDSFQGNEADFVLVSVVRTEKVGFLRSLQRMNVMLTRCKTGMIVVSNRLFLTNVGYQTLLGRMAAYWMIETKKMNFSPWATSVDIMNQSVNLPGAAGKNVRVRSSLPATQPVSYHPSMLVQKPYRIHPWWSEKCAEAKKQNSIDQLLASWPRLPCPAINNPATSHSVKQLRPYHNHDHFSSNSTSTQKVPRPSSSQNKLGKQNNSRVARTASDSKPGASSTKKTSLSAPKVKTVFAKTQNDIDPNDGRKNRNRRRMQKQASATGN
ncbi:hypothetical protein VKT23_015152 [Stygiomarasmius scandens]|uniref:DNA2/NAM7 helicase-like C-terminal domain-containing protein n=1 Tax=Marasmiellus scandens TaxID=2682957 RepID=A0ABR1J148_9AGAR